MLFSIANLQIEIKKMNKVEYLKQIIHMQKAEEELMKLKTDQFYYNRFC